MKTKVKQGSRSPEEESLNTVAHKGHYALSHNIFLIIKKALQIMHNTFQIPRNTLQILRNTF